jgi:hypothetical protein
MTQYLPPKPVYYSFPETTSTFTEIEVSEKTHHDPVSSSSNEHSLLTQFLIHPLTPNDLQRRRAVSPLKIKIPSKNMSEKPTNTPMIHSVY